MAPADLLIKTRQFIAFLIPGAVLTFSGLILLHIPEAPLFLITEIEPGWIEAAAFLGYSYVLGFAIQRVSFKFAEYAIQDRFRDRAMEQRVMDLEKRVGEIIEKKYSDMPGFRMPEGGRLFGFCKRILRTSSASLYHHLDDYEVEVNLLSHMPLPLLVFTVAWVASWSMSGPTRAEWIRFVIPVGVAAAGAAILCLARLKPLQAAEQKETFESFITFHLERQ